MTHQLTRHGEHKLLVALTLACERGAKHVSYIAGILDRLTEEELSGFDTLGRKLIPAVISRRHPATGITPTKLEYLAQHCASNPVPARERSLANLHNYEKTSSTEGLSVLRSDGTGSTLTPGLPPSPKIDLALKLHLAIVDPINTRYIRRLEVLGEKLIVSFYGNGVMDTQVTGQNWLFVARQLHPQLKELEWLGA